MGIQAHLLAQALGRGFDETPDWELLEDQFEFVPSSEEGSPLRYICIDSTNELFYGCTFDEKGRPVDDTARANEKHMCKAQNEILELAITAASEEQDKANVNDSGPSDVVLMDETPWLHWALLAFDVFDHASHLWLEGLVYRLLAFKSSSDMSLTHLIQSDLRRSGLWNFVLPGSGIFNLVIRKCLQRFFILPLFTFPVMSMLIEIILPFRLQILQRLLLLPTFSLESKVLQVQLRTLTDISLSRGVSVILTSGFMAFSALVHEVLLKICSLSVHVDYDRSLDAVPLEQRTTMMHSLYFVPRRFHAMIGRSIRWTTDPPGMTETPTNALVRRPPRAAVCYFLDWTTSVMLLPVASLVVRTQALRFAKTYGFTLLEQDVYPLFPPISFLGLQTAARVAGKIMLCQGISGALGAAATQVRIFVAKRGLEERRRR